MKIIKDRCLEEIAEAARETTEYKDEMISSLQSELDTANAIIDEARRFASFVNRSIYKSRSSGDSPWGFCILDEKNVRKMYERSERLSRIIGVKRK